MNYRIEFLSSADREFLALPKPVRLRIGSRIDALAGNPRPAGCTKLSGYKNLWRIRAGDYRMLYTIDDPAMVISITKIAHRRDVYRGL